MLYSPLKALSVPALRVTSNCSGVNCCFHSASVLWTFFTRAGPSVCPESLNWTIVTVSLSSDELVLEIPKFGLSSHASRPAPVNAEFTRNFLRFMYLSDLQYQPNVNANACTPGSRN